jgi:hypothetical protein
MRASSARAPQRPPSSAPIPTASRKDQIFMRSYFLAVAAVLAGAGVAPAQPTTAPAGPTPMPPKLYLQAGYSQPDITPGMCQNVSPKETRCTVPGMTAGAYLIVAQGTSTAQGDGAVQAIDIRVGNPGAPCMQAQSKNTGDGSKPWASGPQTIKVSCIVRLLTDTPVVIRTTYADQKAVSDPKGPSLSMRRLPWSPVVDAAAGAGGTEQPPKPGAAPPAH